MQQLKKIMNLKTPFKNSKLIFKLKVWYISIPKLSLLKAPNGTFYRKKLKLTVQHKIIIY